jgi:hypothetical protein
MNDPRANGGQCVVGWFTIALGAGAAIPREGVGLMSLLQANGTRSITAVAMIVVGTALVVLSYKPGTPLWRTITLAAGMLLWGYLSVLFVQGKLWGATIQSVVAICVFNQLLFRVWRWTQGTSDASDSEEKAVVS